MNPDCTKDCEGSEQGCKDVEYGPKLMEFKESRGPFLLFVKDLREEV